MTPSDFAFPLDGIDAIVAHHNIAGSAGVLNAAGDELEASLFSHYAPRGIDHIPFVEHQPPQNFIYTAEVERLAPHAEYRQEIAHIPFRAITDLSDLAQMGIRKALYIPYIRLVDEKLPDNIEWVRYGLLPSMTVKLKDKAFMHNWLLQHGFAKHLPNFIACDATFIPRFGMRMIRKIADMLELLGMRDRYPLGLMIRGALSDGNYAMASVSEALHDINIRGQHVKKGQFMLKPNGKTDDLEVFDEPQAALRRVLEHIRHENNPDLDDRVVMSRLLDLEISPGLCTAIVAGLWHDFAFNGQYMEPGNSACTGTTTFRSAVGDETALRLSNGYLEQSQALLRDILSRFFADRPIDDLYAMLNIDVMVVGELERELYERAKAHPQGQQYFDSIGSCNANYSPGVYNPDTVLFAEVNPRDTNWTIAMKAVLQALNLPCTVENLKRLGSGEEIQVLARDHWALPEGMSIEQARQHLLDFHRQLAEQGEGFIMRMPDNPAGIILYTSSPDPNRLTEIAYEAFGYLAEQQHEAALA
jgi:hypothetical protein